jgi:membrane-bound lytic murein transglycosylase F
MFNRKKILIFTVLPSLFLLLAAFSVHVTRQAREFPLKEQEYTYDLNDIRQSGVLRATTNFNSTNYFIYRGEPMGFHLELLRQFATHLGVGLEVNLTNELDENFDCLLNQGGCDLIAMDLTVTKSRREQFLFTEPHSFTRQVLVQRRFPGGNHAQLNGSSGYMARNQFDLAGKTVHVQKKTAFVSRLKSLMEEIGDTIYIVEMQESTEQLIEMVAKGDIDFTVSDEHLARVNQSYYANLDIHLPLSFEQQLSWAVRPGADSLLMAVNAWLKEFRTTNQYAALYNKYYKNNRGVYMAKSRMHSQGGGHVSAYDQYFKQSAEIIGWDWRLLASLVFQESRFDPEAVSWAGAFGLMQLMPETAEAYNVIPESPVSDHIKAGADYIRWLDKILSQHIQDDEERIKFILAAYNVGIGHVLDARRLAEKYGKDPNVWQDNVDYYILNKSLPKYYNDPVVRFGFARGSEPYKYVNEILERYSHYRNALEG